MRSRPSSASGCCTRSLKNRCLTRCRQRSQRFFPEIAPVAFVETWGGIIEASPDVLPVISQVDGLEGFMVASGFSGHGFGIGPGAGKLIADMVRGVADRNDVRCLSVAAVLRRLADPPGAGDIEQVLTVNSNEQGVLASEFQPALAARFYASQSVFALERERLFHAQWFCVGRAELVPARGDCLHVHVAGESVLILRQKDDSLRAFYNVCRHRGSRLVRTPPLPDPDQPSATRSTSLSTGVVCPYHAWTYNLDGSLRAAPYVQFDSTCPKEGFSLVPVHLDTWGGFIFVNLATTPVQSLHEQLAVPVRKLERYRAE